MMEVSTVQADTAAEIAVVQLLSDMFLGISYLDTETIQKNVKLACAKGASVDDRSIKVEVANYLMSNFSIIFMGLVINPEFRNTFKDAVSVEVVLDEKDEAYVKEVREQMKSSHTKPSKGNFVINLESYNDNVYRKILNKLIESFSRVEEYNDVVDEIASELTIDDAVTIGFCVSNFMYLIRALAKNEVFFDYVRMTVRSVKDNLEL